MAHTLVSTLIPSKDEIIRKSEGGESMWDEKIKHVTS